MASGWGCQHQIVNENQEDWCRLLKHVCEPGCKGCVLYSHGIFVSNEHLLNSNKDERRVKKRSDNPLGDR